MRAGVASFHGQALAAHRSRATRTPKALTMRHTSGPGRGRPPKATPAGRPACRRCACLLQWRVHELCINDAAKD